MKKNDKKRNLNYCTGENNVDEKLSIEWNENTLE